MKASKQHTSSRSSKRAAVIVWTVVSSGVLMGFAAFAVDLGYLKVVRTQLQSAADASAMAGASGLLSPAYLEGKATQEDMAQTASALAMEYCALNKADNKTLALDPSDITVGHISNVNNINEQIAAVTPYNAIRVTVRKDAGSSNGAVRLYFAGIWGKYFSSTSATATGYLDGKVVAYRPDPRKNGGPLIPISVRREKWTNEIINANGADSFGYDSQTGQITDGSDNITEISLYPEKQKDAQSSNGAGDFGLLHIGNSNQGVTELAQQIQNGLTQEDVIGQFGEPEIKFFDNGGNPRNYIIDGTPGAKNSLVQLEDNLKSHLGEVIGFFIHDVITQSGANSQYTITGIQFGRVMLVNAQGTVNGAKALVIQPVAYMGSEIITGDNGGIHSTAGRIRLVR